MTIALLLGGGVRWMLSMKPAKGHPLRLLQDTSPTKISDAPEGSPIRIVGQLHFRGPPLDAPLTGRRCAYYRVRGEGAEELFDTSDSIDFFVEDPSGRALVRVAQATVAVSAFCQEDCSGRWPTVRMAALLARHNLTFGVGMFSFYETALEENQTVAVLGTGHWEADGGRMGGSGYRDAPPRLLVLDGAVVISSTEAATRQ